MIHVSDPALRKIALEAAEIGRIHTVELYEAICERLRVTTQHGWQISTLVGK